MNKKLKKIEELLNTKLPPNERMEYINILNEISHDLDEYKRITDLHLINITNMESIEQKLQVVKILENHLKIFPLLNHKNIYKLYIKIINKYLNKTEGELLINYLKKENKK